jgi:pimeloyl-ACP methyl ester carboxylesterase
MSEAPTDSATSRDAAHPNAALPSAALLTASGVAPTQVERWLVFLHGILGRGNNWRGIARKLVAAHPAWGAALVDLRAHGDSRHLPPPDDLGTAADDVARLVASLPGPLGGILGHSFGGKVALATLGRVRVPLLFVIDSLPGARPDHRGSEGTVKIARMLAELPERFASRDAFIAYVRERGVDPAVADWLATNLERREDGTARFALELPRIRALLDDYFATDLWPAIDPPPAETRAHLVIGGRSPVFLAEDRARAASLAQRHPDRVRVHVLERADHWVHVDDPAGLLGLLDAALASEVDLGRPPAARAEATGSDAALASDEVTR